MAILQNMNFREATIKDISQIQTVRNSVKENQLSNPALVTDKDCEEYLTVRGQGWVCEIGDRIVGFSIADIQGNNIWALFVHPEYEGKGIGKMLHTLMMDWYFQKTEKAVWLSTAPGTRAEKFYKRSGWHEAGFHGKGEIRFEMSYPDWVALKISAKNL
jgi:GNAT superfamily N-acetyltransferase